MIRIAICEDDISFSHELQKRISSKLESYNIEYTLSNFPNGEDLICKIDVCDQPFDVLFFDIQLPGMSGVEVARKIREQDKTALFIFITCLNDAIYKILDLNIFNFIRKDYFEREIDTVLNQLVSNIENLVERYSFPTEEGPVLLKLYDISYFEVIDRHVLIHLKDKAYTMPCRTLKDIPVDLNGKGFYETYRGILINLNHVKDFTDDKIILSNGETVYLARRRSVDFKQIFYRHIAEKRRW